MTLDASLGFLIVPPSDRPLHVSAVTVVCAVSEDCVLPCSFHPGSNETIQWFRQGLGVYTFKRGDDQLGSQTPSFQSRTSLFQDQISRGNASLLLMWVKVEDQGRYMCYTSTDIDNSENFIELKVEGQSPPPRNSERIYPEPELSWSTNPPSPMRDPPKPEVQLMEDGLYNISSTIVKNSTALSSSCTVSETYVTITALTVSESPGETVGGSNREYSCFVRMCVESLEGSPVVSAG
uniref:Ig-like domain-containing protein n=1 Tax=Takifugu rubripes TaxID=31033 RepID=A0A674MUD7_TAKRU